MRFAAVIHKDEESVYGASVPDLPGCFSAGDTFEEAIESAREAIACHLEGLLLNDEPVPAKTPFEAHRANKDYADGTWAVVAIDISNLSSKAKRVSSPATRFRSGSAATSEGSTRGKGSGRLGRLLAAGSSPTSATRLNL